MPSSIRPTTTRRSFIHGAAAVSAFGLLSGRADAAIGKNPGIARGTGIEIGGSMAGWVNSLDVAAYQLDKLEPGRGGTYALGPFAASHTIAETSKLLDWILAAARGQSGPADGAVLLIEDGALKRRIAWTGGHITSVKFPKLSAKEGKAPLTVDFKWQPSTIEFSKGSGKLISQPLPKGGPLTSNFRFQGLPGDTDYISGIVLPTIAITGGGKPGAKDVAKSVAAFGDLTLEFEGRSRESIVGYVQKVIRDGKLTSDEYLDFGIELLDPSLAKTVGTISLLGCGLRKHEEATITSEGTGKFALTFTVERFDLKLAVG